MIIRRKLLLKFHDVFEENKNDPVDTYFITEYLRYVKYHVTIARQDDFFALSNLISSKQARYCW